jgi:hypothetical protein
MVCSPVVMEQRDSVCPGGSHLFDLCPSVGGNVEKGGRAVEKQHEQHFFAGT